MQRTPQGDADRSAITPSAVNPTPKRTNAPHVSFMLPARNAGRLLALFDVEIPIKGEALIIRRCRLIADENASPWISGPQESWTDEREGKTKYRALAVFPSHWRNQIQNLAIAAWQEYEQTGMLPQSESGGLAQ